MTWAHKCGGAKSHHTNEGVEWGDGFALVGPSKCKFTGEYDRVSNQPLIVNHGDGMQWITGALVRLQVEIERCDAFPPIVSRDAWRKSSGKGGF